MKTNINGKDAAKCCTQCSITLNDTNFKSYNIKFAKYICISCQKIKSQQIYKDNRDYIRGKQKEYEQINREKVLKAYGEKCVCCGEDTPEFLSIDHINDNSAREREASNQGTGGKMHRWLIKRNYPKDNYQLLCFNCNMAKGFFGQCPHEKKH